MDELDTTLWYYAAQPAASGGGAMSPAPTPLENFEATWDTLCERIDQGK